MENKTNREHLIGLNSCDMATFIMDKIEADLHMITDTEFEMWLDDEYEEPLTISADTLKANFNTFLREKNGDITLQDICDTIDNCIFCVGLYTDEQCPFCGANERMSGKE